MKYIPSMVFAVLCLCWPLAAWTAEPSSNTQVLTQCKVPQADITIIQKLSAETQTKIGAWKTCAEVAPFKASRVYYKSLKPNTKIPLPPSNWDTNYLTDEEFNKYIDLIANAPW